MITDVSDIELTSQMRPTLPQYKPCKQCTHLLQQMLWVVKSRLRGDKSVPHSVRGTK